MVRINNVISGTPADRCGILNGDILVSINGHRIKDVIDYMYYAADVNIELDLERNCNHITVLVEKNEYDDLGLEFETYLMDNKQCCSNRCIFCFIDQMPKGMRKTLYFKDDDARLSFLQGNYVTLTNLEQSDINRIIKMKLNINVSVHTTNPELRVKMMRNRFAGEKLKYLSQLAKSGIQLNCQVVCCPGLNDGDELRRTLCDLFKLMPNIISIAVVPVGVTKFRDGLYPLTTFTKETAAETVNIIEEFQDKFLEKFGTRTVYPSDEFFITAELPLPDVDYYENFYQYENGVGMMRSLINEFNIALSNAKFNCGLLRKVSVASGYIVYPFITNFCRIVEEKFQHISCNVYRIRNDFFGETITVTGLITGRDLIAQLRGKELGDELIISSSMVIFDRKIFLDDLTVSDAERELNIKIKIVPNDGHLLLNAILGL